MKNSRLIILIFLLSFPVLAQEVIFTDGFESLPPKQDELTYAEFTLDMVDTQSCDELTLSAMSGKPMDNITISGLPEDFVAVAVFIETTGGAGRLYPAGKVSDQQSDFIVPVSPDLNLQGAATNLTVTDGFHSCPSLSFAIDPLPAAIGDFETFIANLEALLKDSIDLLAQLSGSDYQTLVALNAAPDSELVGLYIAAKLLDHLFATLPELGPEEQDILMRLLQYVGALEELDELNSGIQDWLTNNGTINGATSVAAASLRGQDQGLLSVPLAVAIEGDCVLVDPPFIDIGSTQQLSNLMSDTIGANAREGFGNLATGLGFAGAALSETPMGIAADLGGIAATALAIGGDYLTAIKPSQFTRLIFDVETPILEDRTSPRAQWSNAKAWVVSQPFSILSAAAEQLVSVAGAVPIAGASISFLSSAMSTFYGDTVSDALESLGDHDGIGCISIPEQSWGPFDVTESSWTQATYNGSSITRETRTEYSPARIGQSEITVNTNAAVFGGATIDATQPVIVEAKTVEIAPAQAAVSEPGESTELSVIINAHNPDLYKVTLRPENGNRPEPTVTRIAFGQYRITVNTSTVISDYPMYLTVASTSQEVPPNVPTREAVATIYLGSALEILDPPDCVSTGQTIDLEAILTGFETPDSQTVTWSETGGTITVGNPTRLAQYTAPPTQGMYTIGAQTPASNPDKPPLTDEVSIVVSNSCVKQYFTAEAYSQASGRTLCSDPYPLESIEEEDAIGNPLSTHLPVPDGNYWIDKQGSIETIATLLTNTVVSIGDATSCGTILLETDTQIDITAKPDGTSNWSARLNEGGACVADDDGFEGRLCKAGYSIYGVSHYLYIPVTEAGNWQFTVDLSCQLPPHYGSLFVSIKRFIDGGGDAQLPNGPNSVPPSDIPYVRSGQFLDFGSCDGTTTSQSFTMELTGPLGSSGEDIVTIKYFGEMTGVVSSEERQENSDALDFYNQGDMIDLRHQMNVSTRLKQLD